MQDELDKKLQERQARETGICPIREELYSQSFDEIIRQVTINCAERGFLLVRVRDEIKMTIQAYQTLYESSIAYGMRKALQAEQSKAEMLIKIQNVEEDIQQLEDECEQLKRRINRMLKEEQQDKETGREEHEAKTNADFEENQKKANELKKKLFTFSEPADPDNQ